MSASAASAVVGDGAVSGLRRGRSFASRVLKSTRRGGRGRLGGCGLLRRRTLSSGRARLGLEG
jgi:hypothetical protein